MLRIQEVSAGYEKVLAIREVSLSVEEGEIVVLLGANGAGKSTILRTVSGLLTPAAGRIIFGSVDISAEAPHRIVTRGIVHVQEGRGILARMDVQENLEMGAYLRSDRAAVKRDMEGVFERFPPLKERRTQNAGSLSGGEQQMLAIGRALMARPKLLLLDEPSLGLAPLFVASIFDVIKKLAREEQYTILLVEQNANQALDVADRGYVLETGRVVLEGSADRLRHNEDVQRAYLGRREQREAHPEASTPPPVAERR
jgi:branched-chain amino acid transport system ATP-binding protein